MNDYQKRYFTEDGIIALKNHLENLEHLYLKTIKYPIKIKMYGFNDLYIHSKQHLEGMIDNMKQIIGENNG